MNDNMRIEKFRGLLIAMISEHTSGSIPDKELKAQSDEVLIAEAALAFRVMQIALSHAQKKIEELGSKK